MIKLIEKFSLIDIRKRLCYSAAENKGKGGIHLVKDTGSRIRQLRQAKKITIAQLSQSVQVSRSLISQVEQGKALPSLPTLERITEALGVSLSKFFQMEEPEHTREEKIIVRRDSRRAIAIPDAKSRYLLLSPSPSSSVEFFLSEFPPGVERETCSRFQHKGEEYFFVLEGEPCLCLGETVHQLYRGDSGCFDSGILHNWSNPSAEPAKVIFAVPRQPVNWESRQGAGGVKKE